MKFKKAFSLIELSIVILIIGILVAGVTQSSRLVKQFKLATLRSITMNSPVGQTKDLAVWLESALDSSFIDSEESNGSLISQWYDMNPQTSFKNNAISPSASESPIYLSDGINGLPAVAGDGNNDSMLINSLTDSFIGGFTWIGVIKWTSPGGARGYFGLKSDYGAFNSLTTVFLDDCNGATNCFRVTSRADGSLASYFGFNTTFNKYDPHIISIVRRTNSLMNYDNGSQIGPTVNDSSVAGIYRSTGPWAIFKYTNSNTLYCQGVVGEYILIGRAIPDDERKDIEKYLSKKWGIKVAS